MSGNVQKMIQFIEKTKYHHGLIKILIEFHLERLGDNWDSFLVRNHFKEEDQESPNSSKAKIGRNRIFENPIKNIPQQQPHKTMRI